MANYNYVGINDNFRGMTLSDWLGEWVQWLHGSTAEYGGQPGEILHTRGGLSYQYAGGIVGGPRIQTITKNTEVVYITNQVPLYVNILTSFYFIGENHPRGNLVTLNEVMAACLDDFQRSQVATATIKKGDDEPEALKPTVVQAYDIGVRVHPNSLLAESFEMPVAKGADLRGCAISFMCLIKSLPNGVYNVITSNIGVRGYKSDSDFTIHVNSQSSVNLP
jgi:hypothetical protein